MSNQAQVSQAAVVSHQENHHVKPVVVHKPIMLKRLMCPVPNCGKHAINYLNLAAHFRSVLKKGDKDSQVVKDHMTYKVTQATETLLPATVQCKDHCDEWFVNAKEHSVHRQTNSRRNCALQREDKERPLTMGDELSLFLDAGTIDMANNADDVPPPQREQSSKNKKKRLLPPTEEDDNDDIVAKEQTKELTKAHLSLPPLMTQPPQLSRLGSTIKRQVVAVALESTRAQANEPTTEKSSAATNKLTPANKISMPQTSVSMLNTNKNKGNQTQPAKVSAPKENPPKDNLPTTEQRQAVALSWQIMQQRGSSLPDSLPLRDALEQITRVNNANACIEKLAVHGVTDVSHVRHLDPKLFNALLSVIGSENLPFINFLHALYYAVN